MSKIGYNIKKIRGVKGLSQQSFAEIFDITRGNISSYEEFRAEPKIEVIIKIAKYFSIPLEALILKELSVNDILNFKQAHTSDTLDKNQKKLAKIPYLSKENLQLILSNEQNFENLPVIEFPIYNLHEIIAIENHSDISEHIAFELPENCILFFEQILLDNIHTLDKQFGLYLKDNEIFIGKYNVKESIIELELNQWKKKEFNIERIKCFWKYYGKFEKAQKIQ